MTPKPNQRGYFLISLDFELYWGVRDCKPLDSCRERMEKVREVVRRMIALFSEYEVKATFATVGMLMAESKDELLDFVPDNKPLYDATHLSPYNGYLGQMPETDMHLHFAPDLVEAIQKSPGLEIGSHTFSHYYCLADGQDAASFEDDLRSHLKLAEKRGIKLKSLVFPRNQYNKAYLDICRKLGIEVFRGNESSWIYSARNDEQETPLRRAIRLTDAYLNISGHHTYKPGEMVEQGLFNFPSSRFLRPARPINPVLEGLRLRRITRAMDYAAKHGEVFHLWWHPHNFSENTEANFAFLERILQHYQALHAKYDFESLNMGELAARLQPEYA